MNNTLPRDEILKLARKAGFKVKNFIPPVITAQHSNGSWVSIGDELEEFAVLARADLVAENEDHIQQLRKEQLTVQKLRDEVERVRRETIEECADSLTKLVTMAPSDHEAIAIALAQETVRSLK